MANRYTVSGTQATPTDNRTAGVGSTNTNTSGNQTQNTSGTSSQNSTQTQTTNQTTQNMSPAQLAALDRLITQLTNGGTPEIREQQARREAEQRQVGNIRESYSKPAAFADAQGLISQQMRRTLEQLLPSISRAAEDSGSSGGAVRALLMQDAANKAAESSSALGAQQAVAYGGIASNLSAVMENLTRVDPTVTNLLINALNAAKGSTQTVNGTTTTVDTVNGTSSQSTNTNTNQQQNTNTQEQKYTDYAPFVDTAPKFFGATDQAAAPTNFVGTTVDTLRELAGGAGSRWSGYKF